MNVIDKTRLTRRAEVDEKANRFYELEFEASRPIMGYIKASQHARNLAATWRASEYDRIERELEN